MVVERFVAACQADERVVAALLVGSYASGTADAYSDLDLYLITTDEAYDDLLAGRAAFVRQLGEPLFLENFGSATSTFYILSDGTEGELGCGRAGQIQQLFSAPYRVLLDKGPILDGTILWHAAAPAEAEYRETLRRQIEWFWHDLSHFITALGRGQLWWASGQLEALRLYCLNLARLSQNVADPDVGAEGYFKVEMALPVESLAPLQATFCPQEPGAMLEAARRMLRFYQDLAPPLAETYGIAYPADLERVMSDRLNALSADRSAT
jgi:hypothetical protein